MKCPHCKEAHEPWAACTAPKRRQIARPLHARYADALRLVMKKPRTIPELTDLVGGAQQSMSRWLRALEDEGMVLRTNGEQAPSGGRTPFLFTWVGLCDGDEPLP